MSTLSPEQADTVPEVNRANAMKQAVSKEKARKALSRAEMDLLQSIAYSPGQKGALTDHRSQNRRRAGSSAGMQPPQHLQLAQTGRSAGTQRERHARRHRLASLHAREAAGWQRAGR